MNELFNKLFNETTGSLKKKISDLPEEFLNQYCIYTTYIKQYALGVNGATRTSKLLISENGEGFPYKAAAYVAAKNKGIKHYTKRGKQTEYGEIGYEALTVEAITIKEALCLESYISAYVPNRFSKM